MTKWTRIIVIATTVEILALGHSRTCAQEKLHDHRVFDKYPSPEQLQGRIDAFKREHADEFAGARADFDLAVRSGLELTPVAFADERQPVRIDRWRLHLPVFRSIFERDIADFKAENRAKLRTAFYEAHLNELTVEPTVALRYVLLDIMMNGWNNWDAWTSERLQEYRRRHPDVYRVAAIGVLSLMNHQISTGVLRIDATGDKDRSLHAGGVLLRMLMDEEASEKLAGKVRTAVRRIRNDLDALDFVVKLALEGECRPGHRNSARSCMGSLTESLPLDQQRDFWVQYLDSDNDCIRSAAVVRVGGPINLLKNDPAERAVNEQLAERLRRIAVSDSDPAIRREANRQVQAYEDNLLPSGPINHGKGANDH